MCSWLTVAGTSLQVRSVCGKTYMLTQDEELWEKQLPNEVENLVQSYQSIPTPNQAGQFMTPQGMAPPLQSIVPPGGAGEFMSLQSMAAPRKIHRVEGKVISFQKCSYVLKVFRRNTV